MAARPRHYHRPCGAWFIIIIIIITTAIICRPLYETLVICRDFDIRTGGQIILCFIEALPRHLHTPKITSPDPKWLNENQAAFGKSFTKTRRMDECFCGWRVTNFKFQVLWLGIEPLSLCDDHYYIISRWRSSKMRSPLFLAVQLESPSSELWAGSVSLVILVFWRRLISDEH